MFCSSVSRSNLESIEDFHPGMDNYLPWEDATGDWVNVKLTTVFGKSMVVRSCYNTTLHTLVDIVLKIVCTGLFEKQYFL